jgi:hypothetical protein
VGAIFFVMGTCLGSLMGSSEADNRTSLRNLKLILNVCR